MASVAGLAGQRANSLPDLGTSTIPKDGQVEFEQLAPVKAKGGGAALKVWLPLLDKRSYVYSVGCENVRRSEVLDNMDRYRSEGDLPRLWAAVRRAKLDFDLSDKFRVHDMANVLARATKHKLICENVARRVANSAFTTKDVRVLEKALKEIEQLQLGPKIWKDPMYPCLRQVPVVTPHLETLRHLVQEHRAGCVAYCAAWLRVVESEELSFSLELEVSTARWLLAFPEATAELGMIVNRDVQEEFWRLAESIDSTGAEPEAASRPAGLAPKDAHLAKLLVRAGLSYEEIA